MLIEMMQKKDWSDVKRIYIQGIRTLQAGIFPENQASINLHKKHGFRVVGTRGKIGRMDDIWRDVVLLERRSDKPGLMRDCNSGK
jgi:phosphinothricin acetyltransferase